MAKKEKTVQVQYTANVKLFFGFGRFAKGDKISFPDKSDELIARLLESGRISSDSSTEKLLDKTDEPKSE